MRFSLLSIGLLALSPLTAAWSKEDREIFRIRDEISSYEADPASTFYDILGISNSASLDDINKAYRKLSRSLHPDKVATQLRAERAKKSKKEGKKASGGPSQKEIKNAIKVASEKQARLSLIANILRGPGRDRYDHYLSNGFPLWKGTDYLYNRYRPGFGTVLVGLFIVVGGGVHYFILYMSWRRQKEFVERYIKFARGVAWGDSLNIPGVEEEEEEPAAPASAQDGAEGAAQPMNRRQRRMQEKEQKKDDGRGRVKALKGKKNKSATASREASTGPAPAPTGPRKRVVAENGKVLVVDSQGDVYLEDRDEEGNVNEFLLDPAELAQPTFKDTAVIQVPFWIFNSTLGRFLPSSAAPESVVDDAEDEDSDDRAQMTPTTDSEEFELLEQSTDSLGKAKTSGAQASAKANKRKLRKK